MGETKATRATIGVGVTLTVLVVAIFALRAYTRLRVSRSIGLDDLFVGVAFLVTIPYNVDQMLATKYGLGRHSDTLTEADVHNFYILSFVLSILYAVGLGLIKAPVLAFFIRLGHKKLHIWSKVALAIVLMQIVANVFACIFQCTPVRAKWDYTIQKKHCININLFFTLQTALNLATDLLVYALPLPMVFKLHVSRRQKMLIAYNLCIGSLACIASVLRLYHVVEVLTTPETDPTYVGATKMLWAMVELNVGFIAVSIPSLRPLVNLIAPGWLGSKQEPLKTRSPHAPNVAGSTPHIGSIFSAVEWSGWSGDTWVGRSAASEPQMSESSGPSIHVPTFNNDSKAEESSNVSPVSTMVANH